MPVLRQNLHSHSVPVNFWSDASGRGKDSTVPSQERVQSHVANARAHLAVLYVVIELVSSAAPEGDFNGSSLHAS